MKIVRFLEGGHIKYGEVTGDYGDTIHELVRTPFTGIERQGNTFAIQDVEVLPPVNPQKIIAVGLNYRDHAEEFNLPIPEEPLIFMKPPSSLLANGGEIVYPAISQRVDYEGELALICKTQCRNIMPHEAPEHILGYTCANDVTARDLQVKDGQWTRAKGFDTFCPLGPFIETEVNLEYLTVNLHLNDELRQSSPVTNMIFSPLEILTFVSRVMTLYPGDVILTGTPAGVGELHPGDKVDVEIIGEDIGLGLLYNTVTNGARP
jgi:2-keto-4-pentenoate hydratase/2-oxohepta-3-ene-1,7-dioic acid hydratase in catechol pathway